MANTLPELGYSYDALEPHIDEKTMKIHHTKHHQGYVDKLNKAIEGTEYEDTEINELLKKLSSLPDDIKKGVRNAGGGHANHTLFWTVIGPKAGGEPSGKLAAAIDEAFESFDELHQILLRFYVTHK